MRRNPAACSNALAPSRGTSMSSLRDANAPRSARLATIALASDSPMPDT